MKTNHHHVTFATCGRAATLALAAAVLTGLTSCSQEDATLQKQLIEARSSLDAKTKALEKAEEDLAKSQSRPNGGLSSEEAAKLKARNSDLEDQLAAARAQASPGAAPKYDMDAMAAKLEDDLTVKAKQLRELVQKQTTNGKVDEISLKAISYPAEVVSPFNSAITFSMNMGDGKNLRLMFPVTADLSGVWKLPGPDEVQKAFEQAQSQPQVAVAPAPVAGTPGAAAPAPAAPATGGGASMRQVDGNTFMFNWGDGPANPAQQPRAAQPVAAAPPAAAPGAGFAPRPAAAPAAPPAPAAPAVPAPVMPVQRDVVIKF